MAAIGQLEAIEEPAVDLDLVVRQSQHLELEGHAGGALVPDQDPGVGAGRVGRYRQQVYQWCFRYAGNHEAAMDMAQDALIRAYEKLGTFEGRARFSSWLFAVTRSTCLTAVSRVR